MGILYATQNAPIESPPANYSYDQTTVGDNWVPGECDAQGQVALTDAEIVIGAIPRASQGSIGGDLKKWWAVGSGVDWLKGLWNIFVNYLMKALGVAEKIAIAILAAVALVILAALWFFADSLKVPA